MASDKQSRLFPCAGSFFCAILAIGLVCDSAFSQMGYAPGGIIYYQVSFANGKVRDLNEPPRTNKGVHSVVRIARFEKHTRGYRVLSTKGPALQLVDTGRTVKSQLHWNGKGWVGPEESAREKALKDSTPIAREIGRIKGLLKPLKQRLKELDHIIASDERKMSSPEDPEQEAAINRDLNRARQSRDELLKTIDRYTSILNVLEDTGSAAGDMDRKETGKVVTIGSEEQSDKVPMTPPRGRREILQDRVHVHKLPPSEGERTYEIRMQHPEAGRYGSFYFLAYADTDGDGAPDKLIARSPIAIADTPGQWSKWELTTSHRQVFVGRGWGHQTPGLYRFDSRDPPKDHTHVDAEVYVAPVIGICPTRKVKWWGYLSNIRINVNQDPDSPDDDTEIIIR